MTIELKDLQARIMELRYRLRAGEDVVLTDSGETIGTVKPTPPPPPGQFQRRGFAKGSFTWIAPDFDAPLPDEFWFGDDA